MKTIVTLLLGIIFVMSVSAQITVDKNEDYKTYTGVAGDTLNGSYLLTKSIYLGNKDYAYDYYIQVEADSLGDGTDITCRLRGSMDGVTYTNIGDAITWGVTASDTTIAYTSLTRSLSVSQTVASVASVHTGTSTVASHLMVTDTTGLATYPADTITVAAQVTTYADTTTIPSHTITSTETYQDGVAWRYLQVYFLGGGAAADMELEAIKVRILKTE